MAAKRIRKSEFIKCSDKIFSLREFCKRHDYTYAVYKNIEGEEIFFVEVFFDKNTDGLFYWKNREYCGFMKGNGKFSSQVKRLEDNGLDVRVKNGKTVPFFAEFEKFLESEGILTW